MRVLGRRLLLWAGLGLLVVAVLLQLLPFGRPAANPPVTPGRALGGPTGPRAGGAGQNSGHRRCSPDELDSPSVIHGSCSFKSRCDDAKHASCRFRFRADPHGLQGAGGAPAG